MQVYVKNSKELEQAVNTANVSSDKVSIVIGSGVYEINETLSLCGGIELVGEDNVILKGTKRVSLDTAVCVNGKYVVDLKAAGITDTGAFGLGPYEDFWEECDIPKPHMTDCGPSTELYYGDRKMKMSRYPEEGYTYIAKALGKTPEINTYENKYGTKEGIFIPDNTEIFDNNDTDNMLLVGYWNYNWASQRHTVSGYDKDKKIVTVNEPYHSYGYIDKSEHSPDDRGKFYILNVLSEVKEPGDWYIDRKEGKLYLIPFDGQEYVDIALRENMIEAENAEDITIKNLSVTGCRKSAFYFNKCKNVTVEKCEINNVGAWGAILDWCSNSVVSDCHVSNTGGGGIACSGGDRSTLTEGHNIVKNNTIHDIAYWHKTYLAGIEINGVGVTVSGNYIYDVPHFAIVFQGNNHILEKNRIQNACYESNDAGAIYAGRDWTCRGNIIRYNLIQDLPGCNGNGCVGIYFDDAMSSAEVYGNILSNMSFVGIMLGGGRDFDIHDNYFYDCNIALHFDNRIAGNDDYNYNKLMKHLTEVPYQSDVWREAYPSLYNILDDDRRQPKNNKFHSNTVIGGNGVAILYDESAIEHLEHYNNNFVKKENTDLHRGYKSREVLFLINEND